MDIQIPYAPTAAIVAQVKSEQVSHVIAPQGKNVEQAMCQDIFADPLGLGLEVAPNTLLIPHELPKQLGGKPWRNEFGKEKAANIVPQLIVKPAHGHVDLMNFGQWQYYPNKGFEGKDQAIFRIDTPKGSYRVVVNLWVTAAYDEYLKTPACAGQFNIKNSFLPMDDLVSDYTAWQRIGGNGKNLLDGLSTSTTPVNNQLI